jgi:hypothetical protein
VPSFVFPYHWNKFQQEDHGMKVETLEVNCRRGFTTERCQRARNVKARYQIFNLLAYKTLQQEKTCWQHQSSKFYNKNFVLCQTQVV